MEGTQGGQYSGGRDRPDHDIGLFDACVAGDLSKARRALQGGANINVKNAKAELYPLHAAAIGTTPGHVEIVKLLCEEEGTDETVHNSRGETPLEMARSETRHEAVAYLNTQKERRPKRRHKSRKKNANKYEVSVDELLRTACTEGNEAEVHECMAKGASIHSRNAFGATPLHLAVSGGHRRIVSSLIHEYGAEVELAKNWGDTPLHWAAAEGHLDVLRLLVLEMGAHVDIQNQAGNTALHVAAYYGHLACCQGLKEELHADVLMTNRLGKFPMDMAACNDDFAPDDEERFKRQAEVVEWFAGLPDHLPDDEGSESD